MRLGRAAPTARPQVESASTVTGPVCSKPRAGSPSQSGRSGRLMVPRPGSSAVIVNPISRMCGVRKTYLRSRSSSIGWAAAGVGKFMA